MGLEGFGFRGKRLRKTIIGNVCRTHIEALYEHFTKMDP